MIKLFNQSIGRLSLTKTKSLIQASFAAVALVALLSSAGEALGQAAVPKDPFVILLKGVYQPVIAANRGLSLVDLSSGSFKAVNIYPVSGTPGHPNEEKAIGEFGGQGLVAYHLPGGSFTARFDWSPEVTASYEEFADGSWIWKGTDELVIEEGTGIYRSFVGGHIHMVDVLTFQTDGTFLEHCFCHISR